MDASLTQDIAAKEASGLGRSLKAPHNYPGDLAGSQGRSRLSLGSNDYLGLSRHPEVIAAAQEAAALYGTGATGSRLTCGNLKVHEQLEVALAKFKGTEAALLFPTGYQAAIGTIPALVGSADLVLSDSLNHASLIDGCRLSRSAVRKFQHCDIGDLRRRLDDRRAFRRCLVVTEGVFSMDGDIAPLGEIQRVCDEYDVWLMVDDAHGTGVVGDGGRGACHIHGIVPQIQMGTLSKALGSSGGFICGSATLIEHLIGSARSFIYTTGLSPSSAAAALAALGVISREPSLSDRLALIACRLRAGLQGIGLDVPAGVTPIIPVLLGDPTSAVHFAAQLRKEHDLVAIRPPTVPEGTSRLRVTATALLGDDDIDEIVSDFAKAAKSFASPI